MRVIETLEPQKPKRMFSLVIDEEELRVMHEALSAVVPADLDFDDRVPFWDIYSKIAETVEPDSQE